MKTKIVNLPDGWANREPSDGEKSSFWTSVQQAIRRTCPDAQLIDDEVWTSKKVEIFGESRVTVFINLLGSMYVQTYCRSYGKFDIKSRTFAARFSKAVRKAHDEEPDNQRELQKMFDDADMAENHPWSNRCECGVEVTGMTFPAYFCTCGKKHRMPEPKELPK